MVRKPSLWVGAWEEPVTRCRRGRQRGHQASPPTWSWSAILGGVAAVAILAGCSMCQDPYDYSSPVISGTVGDTTPPGIRAGSAISGGAPVVTVTSDTAPTDQ